VEAEEYCCCPSHPPACARRVFHQQLARVTLRWSTDWILSPTVSLSTCNNGGSSDDSLPRMTTTVEMSSQGRQLEIDATNLGMTPVAWSACSMILRTRTARIPCSSDRSSPYQYNRYQKQKCCDDLGYFVIPLHKRLLECLAQSDVVLESG